MLVAEIPLRAVSSDMPSRGGDGTDLEKEGGEAARATVADGPAGAGVEQLTTSEGQ